MRQSWFGWVIFLCVIIGMMGATRASAEVKKPNIVIIFIDDLGYGGIEPFGSTRNKTPHLNRMAEEGLKMTSFYSTSPVCTPSRASLMTGSYPRRVSLDTGSWAGVLFPKDSHGLNPDEITIAEVMPPSATTSRSVSSRSRCPPSMVATTPCASFTPLPSPPRRKPPQCRFGPMAAPWSPA